MMQDIDVSEDEVLKALDQFLSPRAEDDEAKIFYQSERKKVSEWRLISTDEIIKKLEKEYQCSFSQNEKITKYKKYQERLSAFQKVFSIGFIEEDNYNDNDFKKTPANNREQKFHEIIHNRMETTLKACPVNDYTLNRNLTKGQALRFNKDNKKDFLNRYWENECFHDQCNQLRSKCCDNKCPDCLAENSAKNHHRHPIHYRCCQHDRQLSPCIIKDEPLLKRNYKDMNNSVRLKDFLFFLLIDRKSFEENWIVKLRDKILLFSKDFSKCHPRNSIDESSLYPQYKLLFILKPLRTVGTFITNFVFWLFSPFLFVCFLYSSRKKQKATLIINYALYPALIGLAFWLFNEEASQAFETLTKIPFWFFEKSSNWWFEISPFAC
jgi:hypothetical protein